MSEIIYNAKQCRRCEYGFRASVEDGYVCDYLEQVGEMRNCDTWPKCEKFKARGKKKKEKKSVTIVNAKKAPTLNDYDIKVLTAYRDNNRSVAKTMRALDRHEQVVRYRLKKANRITGYNPKVKEELDMILKGEKKDET